MGKNVAAAEWSALCGERKRSFWCVSLERSDLSYIGTRDGCEQWQKLDIGSAHSRNPRRVASRRDEAWRGVAWRGVAWRGEAGGGGARVDVPLVLIIIHVEKEPPL